MTYVHIGVPQPSDSREGIWTREKHLEMDRAATARMLKYHPDQCSDEQIRERFRIGPQSRPGPSPIERDAEMFTELVDRFSLDRAERRVLGRQIALVLLSTEYSTQEAAKAMDTLPCAVGAAKARLRPFIASGALIVRCSRESFEEVAEAVSTEIPDWSRADMMAITVDIFGVPKLDLCSPRRPRRVSEARQVFMFLCRKFTDSSFPDIGRTLGKRDHTTCLHGIRKMEAIAEENGLDGGDDPRAWAMAFKGVLGKS